MTQIPQHSLDSKQIAVYTEARKNFYLKASSIANKFGTAEEYVATMFALQQKCIFSHCCNFLPMRALSIFSDPVIDLMIWHNVETQLELEGSQKQALTDHLTGLLNRRALDLALEKYVANFQRGKHDKVSKLFSIIFFDLDDFKRINDLFGHGTGDIVLKRVAEVAKSNIRSVDFIARYGGEEFVIIFNGEIGGATKLAERIRETLLDIDVSSLGIDPKSHAFITASFGVAQHDETNTSSVLEQANLLMKEAKGDGKNRVVADK